MGRNVVWQSNGIGGHSKSDVWIVNFVRVRGLYGQTFAVSFFLIGSKYEDLWFAILQRCLLVTLLQGVERILLLGEENIIFWGRKQHKLWT